MSALSDAVDNGPRATSARTVHIEARIRLAEAEARAAHDKAGALRRRAKGDGPLAKSRTLRAAALEATADRRRAKANELRADLAKAKADEAAKEARRVQRTAASTAAAGLVPKTPGQVVGQGGSGPWADPPVTGETVCAAISRYAPPKTPASSATPVPRRPRRARKETCRWWSHGQGRCPRAPHPDSKDHLCDLHHDKRYGVMPTAAPTKGTPAMTTVSGEAVNIEQTRAMLAQIKTQVGDLRGSMENASGSLASGGLNKLAGAFASADDPLDSVLSELETADKHLADQEAIAEAAQAAGEMHNDTAFYG